MVQYFLVLLEKGAVPFCHYSNPYYYSAARPSFIPAKILREVVRYARENGLFVNFLYGRNRPPRAQERIIDSIAHVKMVPLSLLEVYPDAVLVLDAADRDSFAHIPQSDGRTIILRAERTDLFRLAADMDSLQGRFKRLNVHLTGVERFTEQDIDCYEAQLRIVARTLQKRYTAGDEIEINALTDRMLLTQMNNCEAGVKHLTIAPTGNTYICPAFYHEEETGASLGEWTAERELTFDNPQLLSIACAPICSQCDAFQCKRCVYLNKRMTLEINVPSREQCLLAHAERELSRQMLNKLRNIAPFNKLPVIRSLPYQDPFELVAQPIEPRPAPEPEQADELEIRDALAQIYEMQKKLLRQL